MMGDKTPTKKTTDIQCPLSPRMEELKSPTSKRSIDFDLWDVSHYLPDEQPNKKLRTDSPKDREPNTVINIGELKTGNCANQIAFRVTMVKEFVKSGHLSEIKTLRFHALDESGEISIVVFSDRFEEIKAAIAMNQCYSLCDFKVVDENPKFPNHTSVPLGIIVTPKTKLLETSISLPPIPFDFINIKQIWSKKNGDEIDILAIVGKNWGYKETWKNSYRELTVTQGTDCIRVTLWGSVAEEFGDLTNVPIALRKAVVTTYQGQICVTTKAHSLVWKNPDLEESNDLKAKVIPKLESMQQQVSERREIVE